MQIELVRTNYKMVHSTDVPAMKPQNAHLLMVDAMEFSRILAVHWNPTPTKVANKNVAERTKNTMIMQLLGRRKVSAINQQW